MLSQTLASFLGGVALSISIASPTEWGIHKYLLHAQKRNWLTRIPAQAHDDIHHGGYKAPAHYYRDITNEHVTIHFSPGDVGLIAAIAAAFGSAVDGAYILGSRKSIGIDDAAFVGGVVSGTMLCYGCYEFTHHYMHVIGQRRLSINRILGDTLQGNEPDGKLRFSKPLLDDICDAIERKVDAYGEKDYPQIFSFEDSLLKRLEQQTAYNRRQNSQGEIKPLLIQKDPEEALAHVTSAMVNQEDNYLHALSKSKRFKHKIGRRIQKHLRASRIFQYLDNHHFVHHIRYTHNLNVAFPLMDKIMGTKLKSSRKVLEEDPRYWLCPNSPDKELFVVAKA